MMRFSLLLFLLGVTAFGQGFPNGSGGGGGTGCVISATGDLVKGDGAGGCADSGIVPATVVTSAVEDTNVGGTITTNVLTFRWLGTLAAARMVNAGVHTGDCTTTFPVCTISAGAITLIKMATLAANSTVCNNTGSGATPIACSIAQMQALLSIPTTSGNVITLLGYTPDAVTTATAPLVRTVNAYSIPVATGSVNGYLSSTDWTTFNGKQAALGFTPDHVTTATAPIVRTANDFAMAQASGSVAGFLSAADWTTFNGKQAALGFTAVPNTRSISTTSPLGGGGDFSADRTFTCSTCTVTIASGTSALGTSAISSATCATVVTTSATGTATTDNIMADFNADPTGVTGYVASTNGMLTIIKYSTTNNVNFKVCNNTSSSITPGAITLNWRVVR